MIYRVLGPISAQGFLVEPFSSGAECQKNTQTELQHQNAINLEARQEFSEQYLTWWFLMHWYDWPKDQDKVGWTQRWHAICQSHWQGYLSRHQTFKTIWEMTWTMPVSPVQSQLLLPIADWDGKISGVWCAGQAGYDQVIWSVTVETVWEC